METAIADIAKIKGVLCQNGFGTGFLFRDTEGMIDRLIDDALYAMIYELNVERLIDPLYTSHDSWITGYAGYALTCMSISMPDAIRAASMQMYSVLYVVVCLDLVTSERTLSSAPKETCV